MIAVMVLAFTACKKNNTDTQTLVLNCTTEQMRVDDEQPGAKVYLDKKNRIRFEENDLITIISVPDTTDGTVTGATYATYKVVSNAMTKISGDIADTVGSKGAYFAYYPGQVTTDMHFDSIGFENRVKFTLAGTQVYRPDANGLPQVPKGALYIAAKDGEHKDVTQTSFKFKNICGILGVRLFSPHGAIVKSIEVTDNAFNIVGDVTLKIHEVDPEYMTYLFQNFNMSNPSYVTELNNYLRRVGYYIDGTVSKSVKLDCGSGVTLANNANSATEFYIVMRPLALSKGSFIKVELEDREAIIPSSQYNCIAPNTIRRLMAINVDNY
jgi:hypothetical protein